MLLFILNKNVLNLFCKNNVKKDYTETNYVFQFWLENLFVTLSIKVIKSIDKNDCM